MRSKILIIGACGQIGTELTATLRAKTGRNNIVAADIREGNTEMMQSGPFEIIDATNLAQIEKVVNQYEIEEVYLMAAMLSATAEKFPMEAWKLNMDSLFHVLSLGKSGKIKKIFWPSSIAVFGPSTPKENTPQATVMEPTTVYGISKQTGERWCEYFFKKFGVDVRSIRYPGLISYKTLPGGGTTDYAIEIFHAAVKDRKYTSFLSGTTELPMMFMDDAIHASISLMSTPAEKLTVRSSYNLSSLNFTPETLAAAIRQHIPEFEMAYEPDYRQAIADSWPSSIDDSKARTDWNWRPRFDLEKMTSAMLDGVKEHYKR